jgi:hypothetical protein
VKLFVESIAILAPGLSSWTAGRAVLEGEKTYEPAPLAPPVADLLPAVERRRTGSTVKLALAVGHEALTSAGRPVDSVATVFVSSGNDGEVINDICITLAGPDRQVSPTRFHNSVHNAPAGYWSIATGAMVESNVLCAFDASFAAGLLEALTQVAVDQVPVLLVAYDSQYPQPMHDKRPLTDAFGVALVLTPNRRDSSLARIDAALTDLSYDRLTDAALEALRCGCPAARALPLLRLLAERRGGRTILEYLDVSRLEVRIEPCP